MTSNSNPNPNRGISECSRGGYSYWFIQVRRKARSVSFIKYGGKEKALILAREIRDGLEAGVCVRTRGEWTPRPIGTKDSRSVLPVVGVKPLWYKYKQGEEIRRQRGCGPWMLINGVRVRGFRATWPLNKYQDFLIRDYSTPEEAFNAAKTCRIKNCLTV